MKETTRVRNSGNAETCKEQTSIHTYSKKRGRVESSRCTCDHDINIACLEMVTDIYVDGIYW